MVAKQMSIFFRYFFVNFINFHNIFYKNSLLNQHQLKIFEGLFLEEITSDGLPILFVRYIIESL